MRADDQDKSAPPPPESDKVRRIADKGFLGPEFLTWLYFTLLQEEMEMPLADALPEESRPEDGMVRFAIGKRATLTAVDVGGVRVALTGAGLDDNGEVLQAIRRGALLHLLAIDVAIGHRVYSVALRADDGGLASVKLPELFSEPEDDEAAIIDPLAPKTKKRRPKLPLEDVLALRMQCLDELERIIDALFARFVTRRVARAWHSEDVAGIRKNVARGLKARLVDV